MKFNWKKYLSLSVSENEYLNDATDKIVFTGCSLSKHSCLDYLPAINDLFRKSESYNRDKDYTRAIESLEKAYHHAGEIQDASCQQCSLFFQSTVLHSLENIHSDLSRMRKGLFATSRYDESYIKADMLLSQLRKPEETESRQPAARDIAMMQPAYL